MAVNEHKIWKVRQHCHFWIASEVVSAAEMTDALGMEPDSVTVRGSRSSSPRVLPISHSWDITCHVHGRIEAQATEVLHRIEPVKTRVRALVDRGDVSAGLTMVRYFDDPDGGYSAMGWWFTEQQIALLASMGASVDADEYLDNDESLYSGDGDA